MTDSSGNQITVTENNRGFSMPSILRQVLSRGARVPTFVLEGILGVYNYGCEAIVRGTVAILRQEWPDARIIYHSYRAEEDRRALAGCDVVVDDSRRYDYRPLPLWQRRLQRVTGFPRPRSPYDWARKADCILEIGGDILTLSPEQHTHTEFYQVQHLQGLLGFGRPVVLWGASVGPFEANPHAIDAFREVLLRLTLQTIREEETWGYLDAIGASNNASLVADPGFVMDAAPANDPLVAGHLPSPDRRTLGVNLSPHSLHYAYAEPARRSAHVVQARLVASMIEAYDADVVLIPHVICPWVPTDDDAAYLARVLDAVPEHLKSRVQLLPSDLGAQRTKAVIAKCDCLIAARMHCAIAGMSSGVPTLLLSYSQKAVGMCKYVYDHQRWVIPVDSENSAILARLGEMLTESDSIRAHLDRRHEPIRADAYKAGELLHSVPAFR